MQSSDDVYLHSCRTNWAQTCSTSVKGVQKVRSQWSLLKKQFSFCWFCIFSFKLTHGEDVIVAVDPAVLVIVKSVLGLRGAHVVLNNVDNKDHNDGQESKYLSRVVEDQNVLPYRKHGNAMVHDQWTVSWALGLSGVPARQFVAFLAFKPATDTE